MRFVLPLLAALAACGGTHADEPATHDRTTGSAAGPNEVGAFDAPPSADPTKDALGGFTPSFPRVINVGGHVIGHPVVQPIVFEGDPMASAIGDFTQKVSASSYWQGIGAEYGVSAIAPHTPIAITDAAAPTAITANQIEAWLRERLTNNQQPFGAADPSTLYIVYYPSGTTITAPELGTSCTGFGGYHGEIDVSGKAIGYAVIPRCSDLDTLTVSASHEMFEWATNPFPKTQPAYARVDDAHAAWNTVMVGEIADLCTFLDRENVLPLDVGYRVQRQWSNALSQVGSFPCVPYDGIANYQAIPETPDLIGTERGIAIPKNGTRTVPVHLYSDLPLSVAMTIKVLTNDAWYGRPSTTGIQPSLSTTHGNAGDVVTLTLDASANATQDVIVLFARSGTATHVWPVTVIAK